MNAIALSNSLQVTVAGFPANGALMGKEIPVPNSPFTPN
jgi:hypothetical protein